MRLRTATVVAVLVLGGIMACDAADGLGGPLVIITDGWQEVGGNRNFILQALSGTQDGGHTGAFDGQESLSGDSVTGTWSNGRVNMTVKSNPVVSWQARVRADMPDTLRFGRVGGVDSLVLFASSRTN